MNRESINREVGFSETDFAVAVVPQITRGLWTQCHREMSAGDKVPRPLSQWLAAMPTAEGEISDLAALADGTERDGSWGLNDFSFWLGRLAVPSLTGPESAFGLCTWGQDTRLQTGPASGWLTYSRPSLLPWVKRLGSPRNADLTERSLVVPSPMIVDRGEWIFVSPAGVVQLSRIRATPAARRSLALANGGIAIGDLISLLRQDGQSYADQDPQFVVAGLLRGGFLAPPEVLLASDGDLFNPRRPSEGSRLDLSVLPAELVELAELCRGFDLLPYGKRQDHVRRLRAHMSHLALGPDSLTISVRASLASNQVSVGVADMAIRAASALLRLAKPGRNRSLSAYARAYRERYGGAEVPLVLLLDRGSGLGPPYGYQGSRMPRPKPDAPSDVELMLRQYAETAYKTGASVVDLDEGTSGPLNRFAQAAPPAPGSMDLRLGLASDEQGHPIASVYPFAGADPLGRSYPDLVGLLDGPEHLAVSHQIASAARLEGAIEAEIEYPATVPRIDTAAPTSGILGALVTSVPAARLGWAARVEIPLGEVVVGVDELGFYLKHGEDFVAARSTHLANTFHAPNAVRFADEITDARTLHALPPTWHPSGSMPRVARLMAGPLVLGPAKWLVPKELYPDSARPTRSWTKALSRWCSREGVPRSVFLETPHRSPESDSRVPLDLSIESCRETFFQELKRSLVSCFLPCLAEMSPSWDDALLNGPDGDRLVDFITPLTRK